MSLDIPSKILISSLVLGLFIICLFIFIVSPEDKFCQTNGHEKATSLRIYKNTNLIECDNQIIYLKEVEK